MNQNNKINQRPLKPFISISLFLVLAVSITNCNNRRVSKENIVHVCQSNSAENALISIADGAFQAFYTAIPIQIDGCDQDSIWAPLDWYAMNYVWMGDSVNSADYYGKFKLAWDSEHLYILVHIVDDYLNPTLENGIENYWKGDYVELFIDEDRSGGDHKFNHQAFAYHISTEGHAIDKNTGQETAFYDDHIKVKRSQEDNTYLWELAVKLYDDTFDESAVYNTPVLISKNKRIGFSIGYGDNDGKNSREHFIGSKKSHGINNDEGYINSDVFGSVLFRP